MEIKFDASQEYQLQAIEAVARLFEGQPRGEEPGLSFGVIANQLALADDALLQNLRAVQLANELEPDDALALLSGERETPDGPAPVAFPNFSVEMETGSGKTYVYIRTALELAARYGLRKYLIIVPSVAIREGVLKTFQMTKAHFAALYDNLPYQCAVYDSANITRVRGFASSSAIEFLVMTIDSFNKASNVIRQSADRLMGDTPLQLIQATRPILLLDEPQNMESERSVAALASLNPTCALRYSATHRNPYNLIYRLTPAQAYRQRLVKRIEVAGMVERDDHTQAYIRIDDISSVRQTVSARGTVHKLMRDGSIKEQSVTLKYETKLEELTGRQEYASYEVEEISVAGQYVRFTNGVEARAGVALGPDTTALFRAQIAYTIEEHFRRQRRLREVGVKVLTLFFIDRVDNYTGDDALLRRLFDEEYTRLAAQRDDWRDRAAAAVQKGYFAQRRAKGPAGGKEAVNSVSGESEADADAYDLIMKEKERLLSFDEPVAFIFSHSALREGWDNPNVFQICTLNQIRSEVKKRQIVGRGMRLAVNQTGERVRDDQVNILTVVANESYERYVSQLQQETVEEFGAEGSAPAPINARERQKYTARLRKARLLSPEFRALWEKISRKTRYSVTLDTAKLIEEAGEALGKETVSAPRLVVRKGEVFIGEAGEFAGRAMMAEKDVGYLETTAPLPDLLGLITTILERSSPPTRVSRATLLRVVQCAGNIEQALRNPQEYAARAARILKDALAEQLINGVRYEPVGGWYDMTEFGDEVQSLKALIQTAGGADEGKSLYDGVAVDSGVESAFLSDLESRPDVLLYVKLPNWFRVDTPVGEYNPDWAIIMRQTDAHAEMNSEQLYLVRETKSTLELSALRDDERRKLIAGSRHFNGALHGDYQVVTSAAQLPAGGKRP